MAIVNDQDLRNKIIEAQEKDKLVRSVKSFLSKRSLLPLKMRKGFEDYTMAGEILMRNDQVYIPNDNSIKKLVLESHHDTKTAGHLGRSKTLELVMRDFWWPTIRSYVNSYIDGCDLCQRTKTRTTVARGPLMPLEIPQGPWQSISYDLIVRLPDSNGYDSILNVVDRFTKMAHFIPCHESPDAPTTAPLFVNHVFTDVIYIM
jgi:hypothetical protein